MLFWLLAIAITVIVCAALYYAAAGRMVNATALAGADATRTHFRLQLAEIETDIGSGRLAGPEGIAAKAELARELLRQQKDGLTKVASRALGNPLIVPASIVLVAAIAFATYAFLGSPSLPSQPFASRPDEAAQNINLDDAIKAVEAPLGPASRRFARLEGDRPRLYAGRAICAGRACFPADSGAGAGHRRCRTPISPKR